MSSDLSICAVEARNGAHLVATALVDPFYSEAEAPMSASSFETPLSQLLRMKNGCPRRHIEAQARG